MAIINNMVWTRPNFSERPVISGERGLQSLAGKKVVILGGAGFIGTNLAHRLTQLGASVTRYGRNDRYNEGLQDSNWITGTFSDPASVARAVVGHEIVFHCISESVPGSSNVDIVGDLLANVANTLNLLRICRDSGIAKFIFASSGGTVYGKTHAGPCTEASETNPISAYGVSKLAIEKYLALYKHLYGLDYRVVRISNPYGRFQRSHRQQGLVAAVLERAYRELPVEIWGDGSVIRDYIAVDDLIDGMIRVACYDGDHRIFNIGSGIGRSINDVVDAIEQVIARPVMRKHVFGRPTDIPYNVLDISLIRQELGWEPVRPWADSLSETALWLKSDLLLHGSG